MHRASFLAVVLLTTLTIPLVAQERSGSSPIASANPLLGAAAPSPVPPCTTADVATPAAPKPPEYLIGEGDVLRINVWKEPDLSLNAVTVRPDGMISVPLLGAVKVGGYSPTDIQDQLTEKFSKYLSHPKVTITVTEVRSKSVYVTGEVIRPGVYALSAPTGVLQVLVMAGGPTPFAHRKSMFVLRNAAGRQEKIPFNYTRLLHGEANAQNIQLQPGDTVVVP